jgi:hypothetical protein
MVVLPDMSAQVKWALAKTKDNVTKSAILLGCNRSTIYDFIRNNPELQEFRYHVIGAMCDRAQEVVFDAVDNRDRGRQPRCADFAQSVGHAASGVEKQANG